jgi:hypothetical protein
MKTIIAAIAAALSLMAFVPVADAAIVTAFGTQLNVTDNFPEEQFNDEFVITQVDHPNPWIVRIVNNAGDPAEPLLLADDTSADLSCSQDDPRQVTCVRFTGGPPINVNVNGGFGNDKITVGPHASSVNVDVRGHFGDDTLQLINGSVETYSCGGGTDSVLRDSIDKLVNPALPSDCESGEPAGGGGGGGGAGGGGAGGGGAGGGAGGGGSVTPPPPPPIEFALAGVATERFIDLIKSRWEFAVRTPTASNFMAHLSVNKKVAKKLGIGKKAVVIAKGSKVLNVPGGTLRLTTTKKAKKAIKKNFAKLGQVTKLKLVVKPQAPGLPTLTKTVRFIKK